MIVQMVEQVLKESILVFYHGNHLYCTENKRPNATEVRFSNHMQICYGTNVLFVFKGVSPGPRDRAAIISSKLERFEEKYKAQEDNLLEPVRSNARE